MATKRVRWNFMSSKRAFISFLILNYVDSDAFYHLIFSLFCSIVYRGTERTFFKVWWYCGSHGYEGSNNTAFKVWNLIFYFLKNYRVRYYIKLAREAQNRTKEMIRTSIEIFYLRKDRCSTSWPKYSLLMCTLLYNIMLCLSSG